MCRVECSLEWDFCSERLLRAGWGVNRGRGVGVNVMKGNAAVNCAEQ